MTHRVISAVEIAPNELLVKASVDSRGLTLEFVGISSQTNATLDRIRDWFGPNKISSDPNKSNYSATVLDSETPQRLSIFLLKE